MALSNAIIPILPRLDNTLQIQAYIYSAYFFGAMVTTLPGGIFSDRIGQLPVVCSGFILTIISGAFLMIVTDPILILLSRLVEGVGAGFFVAAALSWINYQSDHARLSGIFMALLNLGLLMGLVGGGWITGLFGDLSAGIRFFTFLTILPFLAVVSGMAIREDKKKTISAERVHPGWRSLMHEVAGMAVRQAPLWYSVIILLGITGFVQAFYPDLSGLPSQDIGTALAMMNLATIIASIIAPWFRIEPVLLIRISSIIMGGLVLIFVQYPSSVFVMGFVAGLIMISQISYLAVAEEHQGIAMGLFSTSSYAGMTLLPALGGFIAGQISVSAAVICIALFAGGCFVFIGRCGCRGFSGSSE